MRLALRMQYGSSTSPVDMNRCHSSLSLSTSCRLNLVSIFFGEIYNCQVHMFFLLLFITDLLQGASLWCQQFRGMFVKRVLTTLRHPLAITLQLLLPVVLTICALLILKLIGTTYTDPDLLINMSNLKASQAYVADFREGLAREERSYLNEVP